MMTVFATALAGGWASTKAKLPGVISRGSARASDSAAPAHMARLCAVCFLG